MSTAPNMSGMKNKANTTNKPTPMNHGEIAPNRTIAVITHLRCGCAGTTAASRAGAQRIFFGETVDAATCGPRGSPFQMPTRLADGLGLESDLNDGSPPLCAPSSDFSEGLVPPRCLAGRQDSLGCNWSDQ